MSTEDLVYMVDQKPTNYEIEVLKCLAGLENKVTGWGAAVGQAIEFLRGMGYVRGLSHPCPSEKGYKLLEELGVYKPPVYEETRAKYSHTNFEG